MKTMKAKFEMSLWLRIKAACALWWAIVVTGELECVDDEEEELKIDPTCLVHGKKMSEHLCLYCCLCFEPLTPEQCHVRENGTREDVCKSCAAQEQTVLDFRCPVCGGLNGKHKQVDDPPAAGSHMLTLKPCPLDKQS